MQKLLLKNMSWNFHWELFAEEMYETFRDKWQLGNLWNKGHIYDGVKLCVKVFLAPSHRLENKNRADIWERISRMCELDTYTHAMIYLLAYRLTEPTVNFYCTNQLHWDCSWAQHGNMYWTQGNMWHGNTRIWHPMRFFPREPGNIEIILF